MTIAHVDCSIEAFYEAIEEEFQKVESDPNAPCKHFVYQGIRYVRCDKCREIWKTRTAYITAAKVSECSAEAAGTATVRG